jgi:hypothetical protein
MPRSVQVDTRLPARRRLLIGILIAVATLAVLLRITAIAEPLGIDQGLWASAVRGMSRGQRLYRDVWEQRPPGIYWIYSAGFRILGWKAATVAWLDIFAAAATTVLLGAIARALAGPLAGAVAAAMYAALTMPAWLYSYDGFLERSVCETFIVVCVGVAAVAAQHVAGRRGNLAAWMTGVASGAAVVLKPNAGLYFPALAMWILLYRPQPWRRQAAVLLNAITGAIVVPAIAVVWLWRLDLLHDAKVAVIDFNRFYVGLGFSPAAYAVKLAHAVWLRMKTDPVWVCGSVAGVVALFDLARRRRLSPLAGLALLWGGAALLVIVVNGAWLFNSYFIQAFPPLTLASAWFVADALTRRDWRRWLATGVFLLMAALVVRRGYAARVYQWAAADASRLFGRSSEVEYLDRFGGYANNRGYSARANAELAAYIRAHTNPDDRIFLFGINGASVYFAADRLTAHRFLRVNFFVGMDFPNPDFSLPAVAAALRERRPVYVIFEQLHSPSEMGRQVDGLQSSPALAALLSRYQREVDIEDFTLFRRLH